MEALQEEEGKPQVGMEPIQEAKEELEAGMESTPEENGEKETIDLSKKSRGVTKVGGPGGLKQWELLMKKFNDANALTCKSVPQEINRKKQPKKTFPTGSKYEGEWNILGMSGEGVYEFPAEKEKPKVYEGRFENGQFEGDGKISYPSGAVLIGKWNKGEITEKTLQFPDGLHYLDNDWYYVKNPDRRYTAEYDDGIEPVGNSYITATKPPREIPPGQYDVGDGFYDPTRKFVYKYDDDTAIVRAVGKNEHTWILENCRFEPMDPLGPCPFMYEMWMAPMLEAEYPPPPAARTANYLEKMMERNMSFLSTSRSRQWSSFGLWEDMMRRASQASGASRMSKVSRTSSVFGGSQRGSQTSCISNLSAGSQAVPASRYQGLQHKTSLKFGVTTTAQGMKSAEVKKQAGRK